MRVCKHTLSKHKHHMHVHTQTSTLTHTHNTHTHTMQHWQFANLRNEVIFCIKPLLCLA